jgi:hypothetical protein
LQQYLFWEYKIYRAQSYFTLQISSLATECELLLLRQEHLLVLVLLLLGCLVGCLIGYLLLGVVGEGLVLRVVARVFALVLHLLV